MMTRIYLHRAIAVCACLLLGGAGCASTPEGTLLTPEEKALHLDSFDEVWSTINDQYWDPTFGGLDWDAVRGELRPAMQEANTLEEARDILYDLVHRLGLSHYTVIPREYLDPQDEVFSTDQQMGETGIDLRVLDNHALVTSVYPGSSADRSGVKTGWEIIRVEKTDIRERLKKRDERWSDDLLTKPLHMAYSVIPLLLGPVGSEVEVAFLDGQGHEEARVLSRSKPRGNESSLGHLNGLVIWIEVRELAGGIGYIAFNGFYDPLVVMKTFNEAMVRFRDAPGLIIDLRGNPGGMGNMAMGMLGWLVEDPCTIGTLYTRDGETDFKVLPRPEPFTGPLAVLVDGLSGSASEFFSNGLQEMGRARIIGTRTKGEALPGQFKELPNGDLFVYATSNFITVQGNTLEGKGVIPDEVVDHTREALLQNRDRIIEAAAQWIKNCSS